MKKCYLDANLLFYWQDPESSFHQKATELLNQLAAQSYQLLISSLVLDEYLHAILRFSGKSKAEMGNALRSSLKRIFKLPAISLINPPTASKKHFKVINLMVKYKLHPRDAYHLFIMLENKVKYLTTFDNDFKLCFEKGLVNRFN